MIESGLWIIVLESLLALALLIFIVWWTMPRGKKSAASRSDRGSSSNEAGAPERDRDNPRS